MGKPQPLSRAVSEWLNEAPWTKAKQRAMMADPENRPFLWLLVDRAEAAMLTGGAVPEEVAVQAEHALRGLE